MYIKLSLRNQFHSAKNKSVSHIQWLDQKNENTVQYCNHYETGEICLSSRSFVKYSSFPRSNIYRVIALNIIKTDKFGNIVLAVLNSGEILLQHQKIKKLVMGPEGLSIPISSKKIRAFNPLETLQSFRKQHSRGDEESCDKEENKNEFHADRKKPELSKPLVFASKDLSIIILLTNYSEIYVWTQDSLGCFFSNFKGEWNTYKIPNEIPMPKSENIGASIDVSFGLKESTEISCVICFSFLVENTLIMSSFNIQWMSVCMTRINSPVTEWRSETIVLRNRDSKPGESLSQRISVVSKFAFVERILCIAVNSFSTQFDMIYFRPDGRFINIIKNNYPNISCSIRKRSRWVSSLNWTQDNQIVIGLTRSGHIFLTSRFGPLLSIQANDVPSNQIPGTYVNIFPNLPSPKSSQEKNDISETSTLTPALGRAKLSILTHPEKEVVTLSTGWCFCQVILSKEVSSADELGTFLLKQTHQLNHELEVSCANHEYDFIHCSNWRLAAHSLTLSHAKNDFEANDLLSLWFPRSVHKITSNSSAHPFTEFETRVQVTFERLETSWSFLSSLSCYEKKAKLLATPLVSECLRFFRAILFTSSANDDEEHQIRLVQCLRFFHHLVEQVSSVACSFFAMRPLLQLMSRLIDLVLESVRSASIERKLICVLILTQTLILFKDNLVDSNFSSIIENNELILRLESETINLSSILDIHMRPLWSCLRKQLGIVWKEKGIRIIDKLGRALRLATIIIQEQTQNEFPSHRQIRIIKEFNSVAEGKFKRAVERMREKLESKINSNFFCERKLKKMIFFIFLVLFSERDWKGLAHFITWFFRKLSNFRSENTKQHSHRLLSVLQQIFRSFLGNLGILLAKLALEIPVLIPSNFSFYDYSSLLDNPPSDCRLVSSTDNEKSVIFQMALRCLSIGQKYNTLLYLAKQLGDSRLSLLCLLMMRKAPRTDFDSDMGEFLFTLLSSNMCQMWNRGFEPFNMSPPSARSFMITEQVLYFSLLVDQRGLLLKCFRACLDRLEELVQELPLIVPWSFPLPAAPVFCPQFETSEEIDMKLECYKETEYMDYFAELQVRKKLSILVLQICFLCTASKTCGVLIRSTIEEGIKNKYKLKEMMAVSCLLLLGKEAVKMTEDEEWKELKKLWKVFWGLVFFIHDRDRLTVVVRGWIRSKANISKYKSIQEKSLEVLREATHLFSPFGERRNEILSLVVSSLQDASSSVEAAQLLAHVMSRQEQVPSLLKERFMEVLGRWKEVPLGTQDAVYENSKMNLFEFYELELQRPVTHHEGDPLYPLSKENVDVLLMFSTAALSKLESKFCLRETPYPFLYQFSDQIKYLEFEGMNPSIYFSNLEQTAETYQCEGSVTDFSESNPHDDDNRRVNTKEKKGLFRNLARSTPWKRCFVNDTAFVLYDASCGSSRHTSHGKFKPSCSIPRNKIGVNYPGRRPGSFHSEDRRTKKRRATSKFHFEKGPQMCKSLSDVIKRIYNSCVHKNFNFSLLSKGVLCPLTWILRKDKILNVAFLPEPQERVCPQFSVDDIKRVILWHCSTTAWNKNKVPKRRNKDQDIKPSLIDSPKGDDLVFCQGLQLEVEVARTSTELIREEKGTLRVKEFEQIHDEENEKVTPEIERHHRNLSPSCNPKGEEIEQLSDSVSKASLSTDLALKGRHMSSLPAGETIPWQPFVIKNKKIKYDHSSLSQTEENSKKLKPIATFGMTTSKKTPKSQDEALDFADASWHESKYSTSSESQQICNPLWQVSPHASLDDTLNNMTLPESPHQLTDCTSDEPCLWPNKKEVAMRTINTESVSKGKQEPTFLRINTNSALQKKSDLKFRLLFKNSNQTKVNPPLLLNLSHIFHHSSNSDKEKEWCLKTIPQELLKTKTPTVKLKDSPFTFLKTPSTTSPVLQVKRNLDSKVLPFHLHQDIMRGKMPENLSTFQLIKNPLIDKSPVMKSIYKTPESTPIKLKEKSVQTLEKQNSESKFENESPSQRKVSPGKHRTDHSFVLKKTNGINPRIKDKQQQTDSERTMFLFSGLVNTPILKNELAKESSSGRSYVSRKIMTDNKQMEDKCQQTINEITYGQMVEDISLQVNIEETNNKTAIKYENESKEMQREEMESRDVLVDVKRQTILDDFVRSKKFPVHSFNIPPLIAKTQVKDPSKAAPTQKEDLYSSAESESHTTPSVRREVVASPCPSDDDIKQSDNMEMTSSPPKTEENTHSSAQIKSHFLSLNKVDVENNLVSKMPNRTYVSDCVDPVLTSEVPTCRMSQQRELSEEGSSANATSRQICSTSLSKLREHNVSPSYFFEESKQMTAETIISKRAKHSNLPTSIPMENARETEPLFERNARETEPLPEGEYFLTHSPYRKVDGSNGSLCSKDDSSEHSPKDLILTSGPTMEQDSIQGILNQFVLGVISIDQVYKRLSTCDLNPLQLDQVRSVEETSAREIHHLLEHVSKTKREISIVKHLLSKVAKITDKYSERSYDQINYFNERLGAQYLNDSDKVLLPETETPEELLNYINRVAPNRLTEDDISRILKIVEKITMKEGDIDSQSNYTKNFNSVFEEDRKLSSPYSDDIEHGGSIISDTRKMSVFSSHKVITSPIFNLRLSSSREDSATCPENSSVTASSSSLVSHLEEKRRKEIRTWMQRKRRERSENTSKVASSDRIFSLSGKVILRRNQIRDQRRVQLRKENAQKRKENFCALLEQCSQENKEFSHILKRTKISTQSPRNRYFDVINTNSDKDLDIQERLSIHSQNSSPSKNTVTRMGRLHVSSSHNLARAAIQSSLERLNKVISSPPVSERRVSRIPAVNSVKISGVSPDISKHQQNSFPVSKQMKSVFDKRRALDLIPEVDTPLNQSSSSSVSTDSTWSLPEEIKRILN